MIEEEADVEEESSPQEEVEDSGSWKIDSKEAEFDQETGEIAEEEAEAEPEAESEVESEDEEAEPEPEAEEKSERKAPVKHLIKERKRRQEVERELAELRSKLESSSQSNKNETKAVANPTSKPKRPTLKDLNYDEAAHEAALETYDEELANWTYERREAEKSNKAKEIAAKEQKAALNKKWEDFLEKDEEYQDLISEVMGNEEEIILPPAVLKAIHKHGFELDKYILKNRETLVPKLNGMDEIDQLIEIGSILSEIKGPNKPVSKPKPKSKAPEPIKAVSGGSRKVEKLASGWSIT